jgi:hypothetical protein
MQLNDTKENNFLQQNYRIPQWILKRNKKGSEYKDKRKSSSLTYRISYF